MGSVIGEMSILSGHVTRARILSHFRGEEPQACRGWMTWRRGSLHLARQARTAAGAALLSAATGSWLPPAAPSVMSQAGCNKPGWPASTSGCKIWLSRHLGEWGNCHPEAWGLGEGQWADEGMEEELSPGSEREPGSWQEWGTRGLGLRTLTAGA